MNSAIIANLIDFFVDFTAKEVYSSIENEND